MKKADDSHPDDGFHCIQAGCCIYSPRTFGRRALRTCTQKSKLSRTCLPISSTLCPNQMYHYQSRGQRYQVSQLLGIDDKKLPGCDKFQQPCQLSRKRLWYLITWRWPILGNCVNVTAVGRGLITDRYSGRQDQSAFSPPFDNCTESSKWN